jgi:sarcosine oxidase subunit beta
MKLQNSLRINTRVVTYDEAKEICPGLASEDAVGFTFHDRDGHADPFLTTLPTWKRGKDWREIFYASQKQRCQDRCRPGGRIVSSRGDIDAPCRVNAAGGYSQFISKMAGVEIPNFSERHEILITEPVEPGVCPPCS